MGRKGIKIRQSKERVGPQRMVTGLRRHTELGVSPEQEGTGEEAAGRGSGRHLAPQRLVVTRRFITEVGSSKIGL